MGYLVLRAIDNEAATLKGESVCSIKAPKLMFVAVRIYHCAIGMLERIGRLALGTTHK